jgi:DNA-binding MarR family transcriptional regulator
MDNTNNIDNSDELILFSIEKISQINRKLFWDISKKTGLSPIQLQFLDFISRSKPEYCTVSGLADEFELKKATVSDSVKTLIQKGYLEKKADRDDGRRFILMLAKKSSRDIGLLKGKNKIFTDAIKTFSSLQKENAVGFFMNMIKNLYESNVIHNAHLCLTCRNFSFPDGEEGKYHCKLLNAFFSDKEIKNNCMSYMRK